VFAAGHVDSHFGRVEIHFVAELSLPGKTGISNGRSEYCHVDLSIDTFLPRQKTVRGGFQVRIGGRIGVGAAVLGLVLGTVPPANAAPPEEKPGAGISTTVTLITGDRVVMRAGTVMSIRPGKGREKVTFSKITAGEHLYVMPNDARRLVTTGQLDRRLFDLTTLVELGYDDAHRNTVPLIVTRQEGQAALRVAGAAVSRELPSINGVALAAEKTSAAWDALTDGTSQRTAAAGISRVWLDGKRQSTVDRSAAQIGAPTAWEAGLTGAGVKVAVLDTGVDQTHPDLADREIAEANFSEAPDNVDNFGHGTHVASILAGTGAKYRGVAYGAAILDGKVLDDNGNGSDSGIIAGMEWAAQQGADIVNLSLGGPDTGEVDPLEQAVESLTARYGTLFVVAAGNRRANLIKVASPGSAPSALTVGAVDRDDTLAWFSLTGPTISDGAVKPDVTAPGVGIVAALHAAGTISPPVEDGYAALSGTSMATPHVAGAAALLAQQHPDWTGQQLKAALSGSAKPTPGVTPFEQGAGRVDVVRALTQTVVSEPTSLNFGVVAWPHDDKEPITKILTYRNAGTSDVTLDLAVDGPVFSLSTNQITVPAGGTASVDVIGDTKAATTDGAHSATVVATAGDSVTRTPVGVTREGEMYSLTLNYVDEHGQPTSHYSPIVISLEDGETTDLYDEDGSVTVRLPKGRYVVNSMIYTNAGERENLIVQPGVLLDRDQTFTLDPAITKPVSVTPPTAATLGWADIAFNIESDSAIVGGGYATNYDLSFLSTAQLGDPLPGTKVSNWVSTHWLGAAAEHFALVWYLDRFPTGYDKVVRWRDVATLRREIGPGAAGDRGVPYLVSQPSSGGDVRSGTGYEVALPATQTAYVTTEGVRWQTQLWLVTDFAPLAELHSPWRTYRPGRTYSEQYNRPVFGPGLPPGGNTFGDPWASRWDNEIIVRVPLFTDGAGNAGTTYEESGSTKLYLGDQLVGETKSGGSGYFPNLPAASGKYRLTTESVNPVRFTPTTVSAEWTFRSSQVDSTTALNLNVVRFLPKLAADGSAPAGRSYVVPLKFQDETGAYHRPRRLTVEVSYDEGKTWQRVPVTSKLEAKLKHPADATSVSFRASATDHDGNTVKQTIIRAYSLR
jgi:subtilisin family serine protease